MNDKDVSCKVLFLHPDGRPVGVWYSMKSLEEAEAFAAEVKAADARLRVRIVKDGPGRPR